MLDDFKVENYLNDDGNPDGGVVHGTGLYIVWQSSPLGHGDHRKQPNGAFVETVLAAVLQRLEFYQTAAEGKFHCIENSLTICLINEALFVLNKRTKKRETPVEGTHII